MPKTTEVAAPRAAPLRRRKWLTRALWILAPIALIAGVYGYTVYTEKREVNEAVAQADRLDRGWRLEELEAARNDMPDEHNAALRVMMVQQLMPRQWPTPLKPPPDEPVIEGVYRPKKTVDDSLIDLPPEMELNPAQTAQIRDDLRAAAAALADAIKLADMPEGRYPLTYAPDFISTHMYCYDARSVTHLLQFQALLSAQDGEPDKALTAVRAMVNAGRSIGDEPLLSSQLVRIACVATATRILERVLAQSRPSEKSLAAVQQILDEEAGHPGLLIAARGERAGHHAMLEAVESGNVSAADLVQSANGKGGPPTAKDRALNWMATGSIRRSHAWILTWLNECVEIAKLPPWQRESGFTQLDQKVKSGAPLLGRLLVPAVSKLAEAEQRTQAQVRCACTAVAVERYRRQEGRWPDSLAALETKQITKTPLDPFDGRPLRYRIVDDGVVIYSVGMDGTDDGGKLDRRSFLTPGTDIGFRLFNPEQRRQPPQPIPEN